MNKDICVIFDFNGTMIFDGRFHDEAWKTYVEELSLVDVSEEDVEKWIKGKTPKEILEHFLGYELTDNMIEQFSEEKDRIYRSLIGRADVPLAPGLEDYLNYLLLAQVKRNIVSTAGPENMSYYFERYNLERWFKWEDVIIAAGDIPLKPHPDMYTAAIAKMNMPAEKTLVFEDSESGVKAAYSAGVTHIVAVTGDSKNKDLVVRPGVYRVIEDFTELR
ncbi:MAG: HAD-IA family hydrolase [Eubacterium sp.]|nr:HAD-IA family hydrolase [Eubacterium sp.]